MEKSQTQKRGKVKFSLYGNDEININEIDFDSILFERDPDALMADAPATDAYFKGAQRRRGRRAGSYIANVRDVNNDGFDDIVIKARRRDLMGVMEKRDTEIYAYAPIGEQSVLWRNTDTIFF